MTMMKRSRRWPTWTTMTIERNNNIRVGQKMGHNPQICDFYWKSDEVVWIFGVPYFQAKPSWVYHKFSVNPNQPFGPRARKNLWSASGFFLSAPKTRTELKRWNPTLPDAISYSQLENVLLQKPLERSSHHQHSKWPCDAWCRSTVPKYRFEKDVFKGADGAGGQTFFRDGSHLGMVIRSQPFMLVMFGDGFNTCLYINIICCKADHIRFMRCATIFIWYFVRLTTLDSLDVLQFSSGIL